MPAVKTTTTATAATTTAVTANLEFYDSRCVMRVTRHHNLSKNAHLCLFFTTCLFYFLVTTFFPPLRVFVGSSLTLKIRGKFKFKRLKEKIQSTLSF
jgi:hypothetical protein